MDAGVHLLILLLAGPMIDDFLAGFIGPANKISHYATGEIDGKFSVNVRELLNHSPCYSVYIHSQ